MVWDLAPTFAKLGQPALDDKRLEALWNDLTSKDGAQAFRAASTLTLGMKDAAPWLAKHLAPAQGPAPERLRQLLADLESNQFDVREKASTALIQIGELAVPILRKRLESSPPLETRQRIDRVLEKIVSGPPTTSDGLRQLRAVEALEHAGTPEARKVLEALARGADGARLTREAKASLNRLATR
jgi:HEAT repeat protein